MRVFLQWIFWRYIRTLIITLLKPKYSIFMADLFSFFFCIFSMRMRRILTEELVRSGLLDNSRGFNSLYSVFKNYVGSQIRFFYLPKLNRTNIEQYIPVEGLQYLDNALKDKKGAILLNPHFGPFLLAMPSLGHKGYRVIQVALQGEPPTGKRKGMHKLMYKAKFDAIERNMPVEFLNLSDNKMAARDILRSLNRNEVVLFASTGRGGTSWHVVNFLGRRARFNLTLFKAARNSQAALLPIFVKETKSFAEVEIEKPIEFSKDDSPEEILERYIPVLESHVKRHPEHFAFFLYEMRVNSWWDDHPFFLDYSHVDDPHQ